MEKEENQNTVAKNHQEPEKETAKPEENLDSENEKEETAQEAKEEIKKPTPEEKIAELEDKVARTFAEMENQRRRFEKEKEEAFEYGGYSFAKEALNLIDNLERSRQILETDEKLKDTEALKKSLEHLDIIKKDTISIFEKYLDLIREFSLNVFPFSIGLLRLNSDVERVSMFFGNKLLISLSLPLLFVPISILFIFCFGI